MHGIELRTKPGKDEESSLTDKDKIESVMDSFGVPYYITSKSLVLCRRVHHGLFLPEITYVFNALGELKNVVKHNVAPKFRKAINAQGIEQARKEELIEEIA